MNKYHKIKRKDGSTVDEHRIIAEAETLGFNTVVHHIDGDKANNNISNLKIMSRSEHCRLHGFGTKIRSSEIFAPDKNGQAVCKLCGKTKAFEEFKKDRNYSNGRDPRCKECFNRTRRERRKAAS